MLNKLKREVQHLKELLNLRRNKNDGDIQRELLNLKEQNFRLRELASKGQKVENLIEENSKLKQQLNKAQIPQSSDGFIVWQKNRSDVTIAQNPMSQTYFKAVNQPSNLFITEPDVVSISQSWLDDKIMVIFLLSLIVDLKIMKI